MKTKKLLQLICFLFLTMGFQKNTAAQEIVIDDEKEWREEFVENNQLLLKMMVSSPIENKEMMKFILFPTKTAMSFHSLKLEKEKKNIEKLVREKGAKGYRVIEQKTFVAGNKLSEYLLTKLHPNKIVSISSTESTKQLVKIYELKFD